MPKNLCQNKGTTQCESEVFKNISMKLCKHHFIKLIKKLLRREFRNAYRHSDIAFGSMDMTGTGMIDIHTFLKSFICKRIMENSRRRQGTSFLITVNDLREFCHCSNIFDVHQGGTI